MLWVIKILLPYDPISAANRPPGGMLFAVTKGGGQAHLVGELFRERAKAILALWTDKRPHRPAA